MCLFFENITMISLKPQCFATRRLWIKQRSSLANPTIVTKLQFICINTELVYIGRGRTTSFNENDITCVNENCKYNASNITNNGGNSNIPKGWPFLSHPVYYSVPIVMHSSNSKRFYTPVPSLTNFASGSLGSATPSFFLVSVIVISFLFSFSDLRLLSFS